MVTILGVLLDRLGHGQRRRSSASAESWSTPAGELRKTQPPTIPLNLHHDKTCTVGEIVSLSRDQDGKAWAVAIADTDELLDFDQPIYYSAETDARRDGTDIILTGCALTTAPAQVGLAPLTILAGDLSRTYARTNWKLTPGQRERVEQAAENLRTRTASSPITIHDPLVVEDLGRGAKLVNGEELVAPRSLLRSGDEEWETRLGVGPMRYGPRGRVLSVR